MTRSSRLACSYCQTHENQYLRLWNVTCQTRLSQGVSCQKPVGRNFVFGAALGDGIVASDRCMPTMAFLHRS